MVIEGTSGCRHQISETDPLVHICFSILCGTDFNVFLGFYLLIRLLVLIIDSAVLKMFLSVRVTFQNVSNLLADYSSLS